MAGLDADANDVFIIPLLHCGFIFKVEKYNCTHFNYLSSLNGIILTNSIEN